MTEAIDLNLIGALLRTIQSEQRSLRTEQGILRQLLGDTVTTASLATFATALLDRVAGSEALVMTGFDRLEARLDQTERSVEERLDRIEKLLEGRR